MREETNSLKLGYLMRRFSSIQLFSLTELRLSVCAVKCQILYPTTTVTLLLPTAGPRIAQGYGCCSVKIRLDPGSCAWQHQIKLCITWRCNFCNSLRNELTAPQLVIVKPDRSQILAGQLKDAVNFQSADVPRNHCSI